MIGVGEKPESGECVLSVVTVVVSFSSWLFNFSLLFAKTNKHDAAVVFSCLLLLALGPRVLTVAVSSVVFSGLSFGLVSLRLEMKP